MGKTCSRDGAIALILSVALVAFMFGWLHGSSQIIHIFKLNGVPATDTLLRNEIPKACFSSDGFILVSENTSVAFEGNGYNKEIVMGHNGTRACPYSINMIIDTRR